MYFCKYRPANLKLEAGTATKTKILIFAANPRSRNECALGSFTHRRAVVAQSHRLPINDVFAYDRVLQDTKKWSHCKHCVPFEMIHPYFVQMRLTLNWRCVALHKNVHHILRQFTVQTCPQYYFWLPSPSRLRCEQNRGEENVYETEAAWASKRSHTYAWLVILE